MSRVIPEHPYLPLISYKKSATSSKNYWAKDVREIETRTRHWGLAWFRTAGGHRRVTCEFGVITETMPDFCGGLLVYSPFVNFYREGSDWSGCFMIDGGYPADDQIDIKWEAFTENRAIQLPEDICTEKRAEAYLYECIAAQVAGEMYRCGKRGFTSADRATGRMTLLMGAMRRMGGFPVAPVDYYAFNEIDFSTRMTLERCDSIHNVARPGRQFLLPLVKFWIQEGNPWYNLNSGNMVRWITGGLGPAEGGEPPTYTNAVECYDCGQRWEDGEYGCCPNCESEDYQYVDEQDMEESDYNFASFKPHQSWGIINADYIKMVRRYQWRNG